MVHLQEVSERESMEVLHGLALDVQDMDETQRLKTLRWVIQKETKGEGNRLWLTIVKVLLARSDLIPQALKLSGSNQDADPVAKLVPIKINIKQTLNGNIVPNNKNFLHSFFQIVLGG